MRINNILSIFKTQILQRKSDKSLKETKLDIKDSVKISEKGKALQRNEAELLIAKKALSELPDVRQEKIQSAISNIKDNIYQSLGSKEQISKNLLESGIFNEEIYQLAISSKYKSELKKIPDIRKNKLNEVRGKIKNNFYNNKNIISELTEKLLKDLGI
jgi:hypothetical protein